MTFTFDEVLSYLAIVVFGALRAFIKPSLNIFTENFATNIFLIYIQIRRLEDGFVHVAQRHIQCLYLHTVHMFWIRSCSASVATYSNSFVLFCFDCGLTSR